jgi:hypothetical protein
MRKIVVGALSIAIGLLIGPPVARAGDLQTTDASTTWQAGVDGVEIEWSPTGSVKRISSKFSVPVEFNDRRGIYKAQVIAEEKAKAAIVRFLDQSVSSTRIVAEVQSDLNKATQSRQTGAAASLHKVDERTLVETLTEVTTSFAHGSLGGVIVLEKGYDEKSEEAWVVVGISDKTIAAAVGVGAMIKHASPDQVRPEQAPPDTDLQKQPSEVKRIKQSDW